MFPSTCTIQVCCHTQDSLMRGVSSSVCCDKQMPPLSAITLIHTRSSNNDPETRH